MYQYLKAPNDRNGNPRRCFVLMDAEGSIIKVIDEGYSGIPKECVGLIQLPTYDISATEYSLLTGPV